MSLFSGHRFAADVQTAVAVARQASEQVLAYYTEESAAVYDKRDGSPVTDADLASDRIIRAGIAAACPGDPILTEEVADDPSRLGSRRCWIADPIDGTLQFIGRTGRFDVLLALVEDGRPVVAAIANPPSGIVLAAAAGQGAWQERDGVWTPVRIPAADPERPPRLAGSIWFGMPSRAEELERVAAAVGGERAPTLPYGLRPIDLLAADRPYDALVGPVVDPNTTYANEWDFAAADLVLHEAGARMTDLSGDVFRYNKAITRNSGGLLIASDPALHGKILQAVRPRSDARR